MVVRCGGGGDELPHRAVVEALDEPEVQKPDPAIGEEQAVAGVRVAVEQSVAERAVEVEAHEDLACAVSLLLRERCPRVSEALAFNVFGDQHALPAQVFDHGRHDHKRMVMVNAGHLRVVGRLQLVVEFLADALPDLVGDRSRVDAGRDRAEELQAELEVAQVGVHRFGDAGVLDLDRNVATVAQATSVHLPDRGRGHRRFVDVGEDVADLAAEVGFDDLGDRAKGDRLGVVLERRQRRLELRPDLFRNEPEVDGA
ncbi:hypothetical protein LRS13_06510 [Svornostia abyssi]|uniref:Uncharacterized protein n=1 Tax=Svornostia abyssi TaxID=2898438 RepID=A0ABY5PKU2_9ACTN|nr:hypothetical protein LRS13_06510 [Parviterribacteraceae bacterium J379]